MCVAMRLCAGFVCVCLYTRAVEDSGLFISSLAAVCVDLMKRNVKSAHSQLRFDGKKKLNKNANLAHRIAELQALIVLQILLDFVQFPLWYKIVCMVLFGTSTLNLCSPSLIFA